MEHEFLAGGVAFHSFRRVSGGRKSGFALLVMTMAETPSHDMDAGARHEAQPTAGSACGDEGHTATFGSLPLELQACCVAGARCRQLSVPLKHAFDAGCRELKISRAVPSASALRARIASCGRSLEHITLVGVECVDDIFVSWLLRERPALKSLVLTSCGGGGGLTPACLPPLRAALAHGYWATNACFWAPHPNLTADQVVAHQILGLRMRKLEGIAKCFAFASPANQAATGPLARFAAMVRGGFSFMLTSPRAFASELPITSDDDDDEYGGGGGGAPPPSQTPHTPESPPPAERTRTRFAVLFQLSGDDDEGVEAQATRGGGAAAGEAVHRGKNGAAGDEAGSDADGRGGGGGDGRGGGGGMRGGGMRGGDTRSGGLRGADEEVLRLAASPPPRYFAVRWELSKQPDTGCWLIDAVMPLGEAPADVPPEAWLMTAPYMLPMKLAQFSV